MKLKNLFFSIVSSARIVVGICALLSLSGFSYANTITDADKLDKLNRLFTQQQQRKRLLKTHGGEIGAEIPFANEFVKLDKRGRPLSQSVNQWSCISDKTTGLIWEVKTDDGSGQDKDKRYRWGGRGVSNTALGGRRSDDDRRQERRWDGDGKRYTDWNTLLDHVNGKKLCGYTDWRMPTLYELATLVQCRGGSYRSLDKGCEGSYLLPTIDRRFFPNAQSGWYWSSSPYVDNSDVAWVLGFEYGYDYGNSRNTYYYARLVRVGQ